MISAGSVISENIDDDELADLMFAKKIGYDYDNTKTSTSSADSGWKTKITTASGQTLQETYVTYCTKLENCRRHSFDSSGKPNNNIWNDIPVQD